MLDGSFVDNALVRESACERGCGRAVRQRSPCHAAMTYWHSLRMELMKWLHSLGVNSSIGLFGILLSRRPMMPSDITATSTQSALLQKDEERHRGCGSNSGCDTRYPPKLLWFVVRAASRSSGAVCRADLQP